MKYVLSKEDLIKFKNMSVYMLTSDDTCKTATEKAVEDFLKSKTPVEEIAEGEVSKLTNRVIEFSNKFFTDATETLFYKMIEPYQGKNIKIYIGVIK